MIAIIDYDGGNTKSILNVLNRCKIKYCVTNKESEIIKSSKIVLPGVSNFSYCMNSLKKYNLDIIIKNQILIDKKPYLGICSGMQVLGTFSEEGNTEGLNIIPGKIKKLPINKSKIVPHVGWNKIFFKDNILCNNILNQTRFYFCHSYYFEVESQNHVLMNANYGINFCCGLRNDNIFGIQFHPEKSLLDGMKILQNFAKI